MKNSSSIVLGLVVVASLNLTACGKDSSQTSNAESTSTASACPASITGKTLSMIRTGSKMERYTLAATTYTGKTTADLEVAGSYTYLADGTKASVTFRQATPSNTTVSKFDFNCFVNQKGNYTLNRSYTDSVVTFGDTGTFDIR